MDRLTEDMLQFYRDFMGDPEGERYCTSCERSVPVKHPHTCYDAKALREEEQCGCGLPREDVALHPDYELHQSCMREEGNG